MNRSLLLLTPAVLLCAVARAQPTPPLPITLTDGDLKATISELAVVPPLGIRDADDPHDSSWTRVSLKLDWAGKPPRDWNVSRITVFDARGQKYQPMRHSGANYRSGEGHVWFSGPIWDANQPWRVRLEFARAFPNTPDFRKVFAPEELLIVPRVPVPKLGEVYKDGRSVEQEGAKVQLIGVAGANAEMPDGIPVRRVYPTVHYRTLRPDGYHVTFVQATDPSGKIVETLGAAHGVGNFGERYARELRVPEGVREVNLVLAVHKNRVFEFTAIPNH